MTTSPSPNPKTIQQVLTNSHWETHSYPCSGPNIGNHSSHAKASPTQQVSLSVLAKSNARLPFSTATSVLDIACGPGTLYATLFATPSLSLSPTAVLLATDISAPMLAHITARQALSSSDPAFDERWNRVQTWRADATALTSLPDGSQSHVLSQMGIFLIPDSDAALREARRVLKKSDDAGGIGGLFCMSSVADADWNTVVLEALPALFPDRRLPVVAHKWREVGLMKVELERNGFRDVEIAEVKMSLGFEDAGRLVEGLWNGLPFVKDLVQGLSDEECAMVKKEMVRRAEMYPGKELPGRALVATATA